ncbi:hypothetical protein [Pseudonocardia sp. ICBG601]|uniref:hypothetical protein n=1 Tax=Pseudonocardia sp. ICBG601 TaxID=2846759 RepID=UPI0035AB94BA
MPFLAVTLLLLLNTTMVAREARSRWLSNAILGISSLLFAVLRHRRLRPPDLTGVRSPRPDFGHPSLVSQLVLR